MHIHTSYFKRRRKWLLIKGNVRWCLNTFWTVKGKLPERRETFPCSDGDAVIGKKLFGSGPDLCNYLMSHFK